MRCQGLAPCGIEDQKSAKICSTELILLNDSSFLLQTCLNVAEYSDEGKW